MLTSSEAAEILGVSTRRVQALAAQGELSATRVGRNLLFDEEEVLERSNRPRLRGRPKLGQKDLLSLGAYTLMCRDHEVLDLTYDSVQKTVAIDKLRETAWAPLGSGPAGRPNKYDLALWIAHRYMPAIRPDARRLMVAASVSSPDALMFGALGLNLSDQYWFRPQNATMTWGDVNFFDNPFVSAAKEPLRTPDSSTPGALPKRWVIRDGKRFLLKGASSIDEREPYGEVLATRLAERLFAPGEYVPYTLERDAGRGALSCCETMSTAREGFVAANEIVTWYGITEGRDLLSNYLAALRSLGVPDADVLVSKMMVADYVMANFDRHKGNFGLMRDSESLGNWRVAPLFDNGSGFFSRATLGELRRRTFVYQANPFEPYPLVQVARTPDLTWYDPEMLADFPDVVAAGLAENPALPDEFVSLAAEHVKRHIDIVNDLAAERLALISWS